MERTDTGSNYISRGSGLEHFDIEKLYAGQSRIESMLVELGRYIGVNLGEESEPVRANRSSLTMSSKHLSLKRNNSAFLTGGVERSQSLTSNQSGAADGGRRLHCLPQSWPECVLLAPCVEELDMDIDEEASAPFLSERKEQRTVSSSEGVAHSTSCWVLDPSSNFHCFYDTLSLLVLSYDAVVTPYALAWALPFEGPLQLAGWVTNCFWAVDVWVNAHTGFYQNGSLVMDRRTIVKRYLSTLCLFDLTLLIINFISLFDTFSNGVGILRVAKLARVGRVINIMKLMKFTQHVEMFALRYMLRSEYSLAALISKVVLGTYLFTHLATCFWYWIGVDGPSDTNVRWTDFVSAEQIQFSDFDAFYQYTTTFHWCIASIALSGIEIPCTNSYERLVNIVCVMGGILYASSLVSILSTAMVEFSLARQKHRDILRELKGYLMDHGTDRNLLRTTVWHLSQRLKQAPIVTESNCQGLALISKSLFEKVKIGTRHQYLYYCPFFLMISSLDKALLDQLCSSGVYFKIIIASDHLFEVGCAAHIACCSLRGKIVYEQSPQFGLVHSKVVSPVADHAWLSEIALWTEWYHVGTATALTPVHVMQISVEDFVAWLRFSYGSIRRICRQFAEHMLRSVHSAKPPSAHPTDLYVPFTEYPIIVSSMDKDSKVTIGLAALREAEDQAWSLHGARARELLEQEVKGGKSVVILTEKRMLRRITRIVTCQVRRKDGKSFVEVGSAKGSEIETCCRLPAAKPDTGETCFDTFARILKTKLPMFCDNVTIINQDSDNTSSFSQQYGVFTDYIKTVMHAEVIDGWEMGLPPSRIKSSDRQRKVSQTPSPITFSSRGQPRNLVMPEIFTLRADGSTRFYSWLADDEMTLYASKVGEVALKKLLSMVDLPLVRDV